jgi:hypothetical protein
MGLFRKATPAEAEALQGARVMVDKPPGAPTIAVPLDAKLDVIADRKATKVKREMANKERKKGAGRPIVRTDARSVAARERMRLKRAKA